MVPEENEKNSKRMLDMVAASRAIHSVIFILVSILGIPLVIRFNSFLYGLVATATSTLTHARNIITLKCTGIMKFVIIPKPMNIFIIKTPPITTILISL